MKTLANSVIHYRTWAIESPPPVNLPNVINHLRIKMGAKGYPLLCVDLTLLCYSILLHYSFFWLTVELWEASGEWIHQTIFHSCLSYAEWWGIWSQSAEGRGYPRMGVPVTAVHLCKFSVFRISENLTENRQWQREHTNTARRAKAEIRTLVQRCEETTALQCCQAGF